MAIRSRRVDLGRIVLDLNTQCDFLLPRGACPVLNRAEILPNVRRIMEWARSACIPVVSSVDAHRPNEPLNGLPRHCVDETFGQQKLPFTLLPRRIVLANDNTLDVPCDLLIRHRQVILAKRSQDFLNNPKADRLLTELSVKYFVVFGVATEICVKAVVLGLIARQRNVVLVHDALGHWNSAEADFALRQMDAKGAKLTTTDELVSGMDYVFPPRESELADSAAWDAAIADTVRSFRRVTA